MFKYFILFCGYSNDNRPSCQLFTSSKIETKVIVAYPRDGGNNPVDIPTIFIYMNVLLVPRYIQFYVNN